MPNSYRFNNIKLSETVDAVLSRCSVSKENCTDILIFHFALHELHELQLLFQVFFFFIVAQNVLPLFSIRAKLDSHAIIPGPKLNECRCRRCRMRWSLSYASLVRILYVQLRMIVCLSVCVNVNVHRSAPWRSLLSVPFPIAACISMINAYISSRRTWTNE